MKDFNLLKTVILLNFFIQGDGYDPSIVRKINSNFLISIKMTKRGLNGFTTP